MPEGISDTHPDIEKLQENPNLKLCGLRPEDRFFDQVHHMPF
jgi:hypothetical protein